MPNPRPSSSSPVSFVTFPSRIGPQFALFLGKGCRRGGSIRLRTTFLYLPLSPEVDRLILDIRAALWAAGTERGAAVIDVALAIAVHYDATILHYDPTCARLRRQAGLTGRSNH